MVMILHKIIISVNKTVSQKTVFVKVFWDNLLHICTMNGPYSFNDSRVTQTPPWAFNKMPFFSNGIGSFVLEHGENL